MTTLTIKTQNNDLVKIIKKMAVLFGAKVKESKESRDGAIKASLNEYKNGDFVECANFSDFKEKITK
ncbi:hypothetical protein [Campylobacter mucosalis]|uniref:Uncharacterized protein n=1 Tax=Campylobacter mucosalis CCUG 21559 TaxID=1032067 RepID=A0A6G5QFG2_9BACT|nr:hypothetical protein [Campylobacter mucosalis]QCD44453.1 hypothetical protein CMUC_0654 [Campylobacter mucosalis CCUG 21559]